MPGWVRAAYSRVAMCSGFMSFRASSTAAEVLGTYCGCNFNRPLPRRRHSRRHQVVAVWPFLVHQNMAQQFLGYLCGMVSTGDLPKSSLLRQDCSVSKLTSLACRHPRAGCSFLLCGRRPLTSSAPSVRVPACYEMLMWLQPFGAVFSS